MADATNPVYTDFVSNGVANSDVSSDTPVLNWVRYGVPAASASAVASLWNGVDYYAVKLGGLFGQEVESQETTTQNVLGKVGLAEGRVVDYYSEHQEGADLGGFLLGAIVPGLGAVKGLQGAQALARGTVATEGVAGATGLLTNTAERYYLGKAAQAIKAGGEGFNKARWQAAAAKGGQFALEGAAFEIGAYAALHQSTQYEDVDSLGDFGKLVASGAAFGGAFGGLLGAGSIYAAKIADTGFGATIGKLRDSVGEKLTEAGLVRQKAGNLEDILTPGDVIADLYRANKVTPTTGDGIVDNTLRTVAANRGQEVDTLFNKLFTRLAGGEAKVLREAIDKLPEVGKLELLVGASKITRATADNLANALVDGKSFFFNAAEGTTSSKATLLAGDLGEFGWNGTTATLNGKALDLSKELAGFDGLLTSEAWKSNAAYFAANEQLALAKAAGASVPKAVSHESIPLIEAQLRNFDSIAITDGKQTITYEGAEAVEALRQIKTQAMIAARDAGMAPSEIAARLNVKEDFLFNQTVPRESFVAATDPTQAKHFVVTYDTMAAPNVWQARGAAELDTRIALAREQQALVATNVLGRELPNLDIAELKALEHRFAGMFTASNAAYGSVLEKAQAIGRLRQKAAEEMATQRAAAMVTEEQLLRNFGEKSEVSVAFAAIATRMRGTGLKYVLEGDTLVSTLWKKAGGEGLSEAEHVIKLGATPLPEGGVEAMKNWIAAHIKQDSAYLKKQNELRVAMGQGKIAGEGTFYIPPPPVASRKFTALVVHPDGGKGMLFAKSADELSSAINRAREATPNAQILQKADTDAWFKAIGEYEAEAAYGATKLDATLLRTGAMKPEAPGNSFQVLDEVNSWYARKEYSITAGALELRYGQQLAEAGLAAKALSPAGNQNAFTQVMDTMFGRTPEKGKLAESWRKINEWASTGVDTVLEASWGNYRAAKAGKITFEEANKVANAYGVANAFETPALWEAAGAKAWGGAGMKLVKEVNTVQRIAVLGLDYWNGVVNAIGTPILLLPEIRAAMAQGQQAPYMKLVGTAISNYFKSPELLARYDKLGVVDKALTAHRELIDAHGLIVGAKTSADALRQAGLAQSAAGKFIDKLQSPTNYSEQFTRFIGADVGRQIAELRGLAGAEVDAFAANFANKVAGNFTAGQRPQVFQGILGNAVGLFQSYQFNYMQQLFKNLAEGQGKNVAMMMGLQGTIFGAQSLPGFAVANYHLLEKHNRENSGVYSSLREMVGEGVGDAVLYGTASNLLGANLWTRGDTSPRNVTILPVSPSDIAAVQYFTKLTGAMGDFATSMLNGGSLKVSGLEAVAHAGINRPLAGMAEVALGARTSQGGKLDMPVSQDLLSVATAVRFLGAKPIEEAIKMETFYRFNKAKAADAEKLADVAQALRTSVLEQETGGEQVAIDEYAAQYAARGGNPANFRKFYLQNMKSATTPRAVALANAGRKSPWANNYQMLLEPGEIPALDGVEN
jgi:hypothetical protein